MKTLLTVGQILLLFFFSIPAGASNHLVLYLVSGTTLTIPAEERPQITFEGNVLCISTERFQISAVRKYTFSENEALSLETLDEDDKSIKRLDDMRIAVRPKVPSANVRVLSTNGTEQPVHKTVDAEGCAVIDLTGLMPDVYVISIGNETFKIKKK